MNEKYRFTNGAESVPGYPQPTGRVLNKYSLGTAIMELPFFLLAHSYTYFDHNDPRDGFSYPYQQAVAFCDIFWAAMGLLMIWLALRHRFSDTVISIVILCIGIGTNLYNYTAFDHGMSHPISFFLLAAVLYLTIKWHEVPKAKYLYLLAVVISLVTLTRPVNIVVAIVPILWKVDGIKSFKDKFQRLLKPVLPLAIAILIFTAILFLQFAYWKYVTGHWIYYSYEGEGFRFPYSKVWKGLFSYQRGWFVYTPIAIAGIIGIFVSGRKHVLSLLAFFTIIIYITFSWKQWWYGGGFGCRPLIDALAILAFPLAALLHKIYLSKWLVTKIAISVFCIACITLNMFQTFQFSKSIIHYDSMSKEYYWAVFGKTKLDKDYGPLLLPGDYLNKEKE